MRHRVRDRGPAFALRFCGRFAFAADRIADQSTDDQTEQPREDRRPGIVPPGSLGRKFGRQALDDGLGNRCSQRLPRRYGGAQRPCRLCRGRRWPGWFLIAHSLTGSNRRAMSSNGSRQAAGLLARDSPVGRRVRGCRATGRRARPGPPRATVSYPKATERKPRAPQRPPASGSLAGDERRCRWWTTGRAAADRDVPQAGSARQAGIGDCLRLRVPPGECFSLRRP